jgi:4-amino-4-deoxy-L-arabinose transferase-like glycosyltransferase
MALFQRVAGRGAVFYLVPLLGGLYVWMTSALGASVHGRLTGVLAALLVAASPSFVTELMVPASDVAAAAWWTTALALTIRGGSMAALGAGAAVSVAVLTRPNLVPLAIVVGLFQVWRVVRGDRNAVRALALFTVSAVPGVWLSPRSISTLRVAVQFGVWELEQPVCPDERWSNLDRYPRLMQTQTPFMALALAAPLFSRPAATRAYLSTPITWSSCWRLRRS